MLHALAKKAMPLGDPLATPPEEKIQLNRLALDIWPVVLFKDRHLGRKADSVLTDVVTQFVQAELFNLFFVIGLGKAVGAWRPGWSP